MASISFSHKYAGTLVIDTGVDVAEWAYGLNTANFPTYGGEVVQILSVYIDDLQLSGTVTTYKQLEAIFKFFTTYMISATQGNQPNPNPGESAYNLHPVYFSYPERNWNFKLYPKSTPGFMYDLETAAPRWQLISHIVDDSPDLSVIKDGIKGAATKSISVSQNGTLPSGRYVQDLNALSLTGNISPKSSDPNTDPFETFDQGAQQENQDITKYVDYYSSLIPAYMRGDFVNLTTDIGSSPSLGKGQHGTGNTNQATVKVPKVPKKKH